MFRALAAAAVVALSLPSTSLAAPAGRRPASPLAVTRAFYRALHAGDPAGAARLVHGDGRPVLDAFVRGARAHRRVEAAVAQRFGREAAGLVGYGNRVQAEVKALLGAGEDIDGDEATVSALDGGTLATLKRVGAAWKLELDDELLSPAGKARVAREARAAEAAARTVVAGLRGGRYPDAGAAVRDFRSRARLPGASPPADPAEDPRGVDL
jgi:hypothetical protein